MNEICGPDNVAEEREETVIPDYEIEALACGLLPKIQAYFDSPEGQAAFAEWKNQQNSDDT